MSRVWVSLCGVVKAVVDGHGREDARAGAHPASASLSGLSAAKEILRKSPQTDCQTTDPFVSCRHSCV